MGNHGPFSVEVDRGCPARREAMAKLRGFLSRSTQRYGSALLFSAVIVIISVASSSVAQKDRQAVPAATQSSEQAGNKSPSDQKGPTVEAGPQGGANKPDSGSAITALDQARNPGTSVVFAIVLTLLVGLIEISYKSKASFKACLWNWSFPVYLAIFILGNCVATLLSALFVKLPSQLAAYLAFLSAIFGVFAFQVIMSNTNITFLGKGVLTIDDWISKARDQAVAAAIQTETQNADRARNAVASELEKLEEGRLDAYMDNKLGRTEFEAIAAAALKHGTNAILYKTQAFAAKDLTSAMNLVTEMKKRDKER